MTGNHTGLCRLFGFTCDKGCGGLVEDVRTLVRLYIDQRAPQAVNPGNAIAQISVADELLHTDRIIIQQQMHDESFFAQLHRLGVLNAVKFTRIRPVV